MKCCNLTPVFLVLLRLAIGWHLLFEGIDKIQSDSWTSEAYLRESSGPLAPFFRALAGDAVEAKLTVPALPPGQDPTKTPLHSRLPPALAREWQAYYDRFIAYYSEQKLELPEGSQVAALSPEQRAEAEAKFLQRAGDQFRQRQSQTVYWILNGKKIVRRTAPFPPPVEVEQTTPQRFQEYLAKRGAARRVQDEELGIFGEDAKLQNAKAEVNRIRAELLADINQQTAQMKAALTGLLNERQRQKPPLPDPVKPGFSSWGMLQWTDFAVKYGLTAIGSCLLLGLFTRSACLGGAGLLLLFYLAMPAFLGMPANPRSEGHYLFINKNIIEMLALLALATTPSGRWAGLDALGALCPWCRRGEERLATSPSVVDLGGKTPRPELRKTEPEAPAREEEAALARAAGPQEESSHGN